MENNYRPWPMPHSTLPLHLRRQCLPTFYSHPQSSFFISSRILSLIIRCLHWRFLHDERKKERRESCHSQGFIGQSIDAMLNNGRKGVKATNELGSDLKACVELGSGSTARAHLQPSSVPVLLCLSLSPHYSPLTSVETVPG